MYDLQFSKRSDKQFRKLDRQIQREVIEAIETLKENPEIGEKLKGILNDFWKIRVRDYRVIYHINNSPEMVQIAFIDHRSRVYQELERLKRDEAI